jgi:hypothetical protein
VRKVAQHKGRRPQGRSHEGPSVEQGRRKNQTKNKFARVTLKGPTLGRRQLMRQKSTNGTRNRDFKKQLHLGSERTTSGINRKTIGLEIVKQPEGISSGLRKIRNWTLWWGRPPPKLFSACPMLTSCSKSTSYHVTCFPCLR